MKKIILGAIDLSFHKVTAGVFHNVLEYLGYEVETVFKPHEQIFEMQKHGKVDLLISAWLPGSHGKYLASYLDDVLLLNTIYEPYCIWGVPDYFAKKGVTSIADLTRKEITSIMSKKINGIGMGAGISRFSLEIIDAYKLGDIGFEFITNSPEDFNKLVEVQLKAKQNFIIPLWHPQYLHYMFDIFPLEEPKGLLRGKDLATPILLKKAAILFSKNDRDILSMIRLSNDAVSYIEYSFYKYELSAKDAAKRWIQQNYGSIESYIRRLEGDVQKDV